MCVNFARKDQVAIAPFLRAVNSTPRIAVRTKQIENVLSGCNQEGTNSRSWLRIVPKMYGSLPRTKKKACRWACTKLKHVPLPTGTPNGRLCMERFSSGTRGSTAVCGKTAVTRPVARCNTYVIALGTRQSTFVAAISQPEEYLVNKAIKRNALERTASSATCPPNPNFGKTRPNYNTLLLPEVQARCPKTAAISHPFNASSLPVSTTMSGRCLGCSKHGRQRTWKAEGSSTHPCSAERLLGPPASTHTASPIEYCRL